MQMPFTNGVPYLSRVEEKLAIEQEKARADKPGIADIHLSASEVELRQFVGKVRQQIKDWIDKKSKFPSDYLNITASSNAHAIVQNERGLNNLQRRLVHQLVRAEFPEFVSVSRGSFIQLVAFNKAREDAIKESKMKAYMAKLSRQIGLRWFFEGLIGADISSLDPVSMLKPTTEGTPQWIDVKEVNKEFQETQSNIKMCRSVLVGHNLFTDLVYLYKCFFGPLPEKVDDFLKMMHDLFPLIVDTKYMATHSNPSPNAKSGLEDLDKEFKKMPMPVIELHSDHPAYNDTTSAHEAGYDSLMTARVFIRLAAALDALGHQGETTDEEWLTPPEERFNGSNPSSVTRSTMLLIPDPITEGNKDSIIQTRSLSSASTFANQDFALSEQATTVKTKKGSPKPRSKKKKGGKSVTSAFSHPGRFDLLEFSNSDGSDDKNDSDNDNGVRLPQTSIKPSPSKFSTRQPLIPRPSNDLKILASWESINRTTTSDQSTNDTTSKIRRWIPRWDSVFWQTYGNKLRVNGTVEGVCSLDGTGSRS